MIRTFLCYAMMALAILPANAQTTDIKSLAEVAGKWTGTSSRGSNITIFISPAGHFKLGTTEGTDSGTARIAEGVLVIPASDNQGSYKFKRKGEQLDGTIYWRGVDSTVVLGRSQ